MKKKLIATLFASAMVLTSMGNANATIIEGSWYNTADPYSPNSGNFYTNSRAGSCNDYVDLRMHNIKYNSSEVTTVHNNYNNKNWYPGLDATDLNGNLSTTTSSMATNYPNPKFDTDNDDGVNGSEESEFVSLSPLSISTSSTYYFYVDWVNVGSFYTCATGSGTIELNAHESTPFLSEYNTADYDKLGTVRYYAK